MPLCLILKSLLFVAVLIVGGDCYPTIASCPNGRCDEGENCTSCPGDCPGQGAPGGAADAFCCQGELEAPQGPFCAWQEAAQGCRANCSVHAGASRLFLASAPLVPGPAGIARADQLCHSDLPGSFALLGTDSEDVWSRLGANLPDNGAFVSPVMREPIARNKDHLCFIQPDPLMFPIEFNITGFLFAGRPVWTGTILPGCLNAFNENCANWTNSSGLLGGMHGIAGDVMEPRMTAGPISCQDPDILIYCVETPNPAIVSRTVSPTRAPTLLTASPTGAPTVPLVVVNATLNQTLVGNITSDTITVGSGAELVINGTLTLVQGSSTTLDQGSTIVVDGSVQLAGNLTVTVATQGTIPIISASTISGSFDHVDAHLPGILSCEHANAIQQNSQGTYSLTVNVDSSGCGQPLFGALAGIIVGGVVVAFCLVAIPIIARNMRTKRADMAKLSRLEKMQSQIQSPSSRTH